MPRRGGRQRGRDGGHVVGKFSDEHHVVVAEAEVEAFDLAFELAHQWLDARQAILRLGDERRAGVSTVAGLDQVTRHACAPLTISLPVRSTVAWMLGCGTMRC